MELTSIHLRVYCDYLSLNRIFDSLNCWKELQILDYCDKHSEIWKNSLCSTSHFIYRFIESMRFWDLSFIFESTLRVYMVICFRHKAIRRNNVGARIFTVALFLKTKKGNNLNFSYLGNSSVSSVIYIPWD